MSDASEEGREEYHVLRGQMGGGPKGLGDPEDRSLRKLESDVIIPKRMKKEAREMCSDYVKVFSDCGKAAGLLMPFKCRKETKAMQECLYNKFMDPSLVQKCKEEYLAERAEYRRTGVTAKQKRKEATTF